MSLINDALKRAQEAQRPNTASSVASIRTIDAHPKDRPFISRMLVVVIFLFLAAAFAFIGLAMTGRLAKKGSAPQISAAHPAAAVAAPGQPGPTTAPVVVAAPVTPVPPAVVKSAPSPAAGRIAFRP